MENYFNDPTSNDGDFTPEERKAIYRAVGIMLLILAAEGLWIYFCYKNIVP
jgi:hypothetical protein